MPYSAIFWGSQFFDEVSEEKNRCVAGESAGLLWAFLTGVQERRPRKFWLFCILNSSKHRSCGHLSIFRLINFYTFESLGACVWYPKLVYQLQNSSGYVTDLPLLMRNVNQIYYKKKLEERNLTCEFWGKSLIIFAPPCCSKWIWLTILCLFRFFEKQRP